MLGPVSHVHVATQRSRNALSKGHLGAKWPKGVRALQKVTDMTNVDLATLGTFDLRPYVTPRAVVTSVSHLSVDLAHTPTLGPA